MPSWITELVQMDRLLTIAFVLFFLWLIIRTLFKSYPFVHKFVTLVHDLVGDDENPGIAKRMDAQARKLDMITHEVLPNHGSSLNDSVRRNEQFTKELGEKLDAHIEIASAESIELRGNSEKLKETTEKLDEHIEDTKEHIVILRDLHKKYGSENSVGKDS